MKILFIITLFSFVLSFALDKNKTIYGLKKGLKMFINLLPDMLNILIFVCICLYLIPESFIIKTLGKESGFMGFIISAIIGSIALIPGFIAYPLAAILIKGGVSYKIIAVFITTLMMVGIMTLPIEVKFFGLRVSIIRNVLCFIGALIIGFIMGFFI
ncbi:MAG TPA: permease [bacterium]|nr:permease [bacterium]HOL47664.1 permease [bacterium]HPQ18421.1 permease [bacterium]